MTQLLLSLVLAAEDDMIVLRQRSKRVAQLLGFDNQDQTRIATAVSEIGRNALRYAGVGRVNFHIDGKRGTGPALIVEVVDDGPGIADLPEILEGRYRSASGMGMGILGARRLMDGFSIATSQETGTSVVLRKRFPRRSQMPEGRALQEICDALTRESPPDALRESELQNRELLGMLEELRSRQDDLDRLNGELEDTNRGVVALYAELDDKAEQLRRANDLKTRFLANMSHEFRTPLNSILALSRLLLDRVDGDLTSEQHRQVSLIRKSASSLSDLINDLLDIAKVEAGKVDVQPTSFSISELFATMRGLLRPLRPDSVDLVLEDDPSLPLLFTDEAKLSQILRNLLSNALKFTERGAVKLTAELVAGGEGIRFRVRDTGIGIAAADQERIFEEFTQVESRLQGQAKGTGLGLPLSKRLAELLGGTLTVSSELGVGTTFTVELPLHYGVVLADQPEAEPETTVERRRVLVIDDDEAARYVFRQLAPRTQWQVIEAPNGNEGLQRAQSDRPQVIVLDLRMPGLDGFAVLDRLSDDPSTSQIPVIVATASALSDRERARLAKARLIVAKSDLTRDLVASSLLSLAGHAA